MRPIENPPTCHTEYNQDKLKFCFKYKDIHNFLDKSCISIASLYVICWWGVLRCFGYFSLFLLMTFSETWRTVICVVERSTSVNMWFFVRANERFRHQSPITEWETIYQWNIAFLSTDVVFRDYLQACRQQWQMLMAYKENGPIIQLYACMFSLALNRESTKKHKSFLLCE